MKCDSLKSCYFVVEQAASQQPIFTFFLTAFALWSFVKLRGLVWRKLNPDPFDVATRDLERAHDDLSELEESELTRVLILFGMKTLAFMVVTIFLILIAPTPIDSAIGLIMLPFMVRRMEELQRRGAIYALKDPLVAPTRVLSSARRQITAEQLAILVKRNDAFLERLRRNGVAGYREAKRDSA